MSIRQRQSFNETIGPPKINSVQMRENDREHLVVGEEAFLSADHMNTQTLESPVFTYSRTHKGAYERHDLKRKKEKCRLVGILT